MSFYFIDIESSTIFGDTTKKVNTLSIVTGGLRVVIIGILFQFPIREMLLRILCRRDLLILYLSVSVQSLSIRSLLFESSFIVSGSVNRHYTSQ